MKPVKSTLCLAVIIHAVIFCLIGCDNSQCTDETTDITTQQTDESDNQDLSTATSAFPGISNTSASSPEEDTEQTTNDMLGEITVNFTAGTAKGGAAVYVMWLENSTRTFIQNLFVCERLLDGSLTGTALPYWQMNRKNDSDDIDGVTAATRLPGISVTRKLEPDATDTFTVFVEVDHSFDGNDWFSDQPALLYKADINLSDMQSEYTLEPAGWTSDEQTTFSGMAEKPSFEAGELCTEMRYITHSKSDDGFGEEDPDHAATNIVAALKVTFEGLSTGLRVPAYLR